MNFGGFQKLTLLDFPGIVACTLFTKGCNFLCPFCHNAPLVNQLDEASVFGEDEILAYLKKRQGLLEGVCITGGEPLLHPDTDGFIRTVKEMGYRVKLDTNGSFPARLKSLVSNSLLDYVAMDIKNAFDKYALTAGVSSVRLEAIEESMDFLLGGPVVYEFRTTVTQELHTVEDIAWIARRIRGARAYYIQNYVDSGHIIGEGLSAVPPEKLEEMRRVASLHVPACQIR